MWRGGHEGRGSCGQKGAGEGALGLWESREQLVGGSCAAGISAGPLHVPATPLALRGPQSTLVVEGQTVSSREAPKMYSAMPVLLRSWLPELYAGI